MKFKNKSLLKVAALSIFAAFSFGLVISCVSNHKQNINKIFAEDDISTTWSYNSNNKTLSCTYASNYPNGFIMETNQEGVRGVGDGEFELSYHVLGYPDNNVHPDYTDYGTFALTFTGSYNSTPSTDGPYGSITGYPLDISGLDGGTEYEIYLKVEPTGDMNEQSSESIYYNNGAFYSVDGGGNDPLVLSTIKFYGDITYENGSADLVFNNTGGDNAGTLRMSSINFYPKPDGDGTSYSGNISGTIASTGAQVEDYSCNSETIFQHEEVFDPNSVTWDWDDSARVYSYDYIGASTGTTTTYKALFLPPSGASGEDQIICEYTQGSLIANVRTTIYNHNNGDPIETGMTKSFEFPLASEPSLSGDSYEFQFGTTVLYTFSIDAIYVRIVDPGSAYDYGWTYEEENQKLVYYDPDYGVYTLVRGINNVMDQVVTLTYESPEGENPSQTMTIDIDFSGGTGGYDYSANTVSGYARLQGESSTAEFITVLLNNKDGNIINLNGANTWGFDGTIIIWINASSNAVPIDDLKDNMTGSTFYLAEGTSNQYCEIHYTYDGRELPTLTINRATYEEHELDDNEGVEYIVSGIFERLEEATVTVTIPGEHWGARPLVADYVVSFDANGGQGQMEPESVTPPSDGGSVSYPLPECPFTKDGCNFVGWGITSATSDTIQPGENFDLSGDQTFYAIWSESTREYTFNITFQDGDATGGSMEDVTITSSTYEYEYTLPACGYEKEGYEFAGWIYLSSGTSKIYQPGDTCTLDCDLTNTFLATWSAGEFVTITFNANGGEGTMEPITVENGSIQTVPGCDFTYEGYDFVEWAVGSPSSPTTFKPGDSVTVDDNYTLYAVWEATPKQYWVNDNGELKFVDENHPEYLTRIDKVIYSESKSTATVLISIVTEENIDVVIDTKYISLSSADCKDGIVTGYFNLIVEGKKEIEIKGVEITYEVIPTTDEEKAADISQDQIDQINSLLPESQDSRVDDVIKDLNQGTAYQIVEVASDAKTFIDELRQEGGEGYTEEDYQRDLNTVQSATEAAVVVGAASKDANIAAQVEDMTKSIPDDHGVDLSGVLKEFYEQQMSYLLGEEVASKEGETPSKGRTRALAPKVNKVDVNDFLKQEFDQMLDFVDRSVVNIEGTLLQVRKCSHASVKIAVNQTITKITTESFRNFDKDKADREFVEKLEPVMMATMQSQVLATLEEEYNKSNHRNKEKDQVMLDEIEAIKDIETFRIIVMEVLRQKYEALTGITYGETAEDLQKFTDEVYWPVFEAWALDKDSPNGITFEELTKATIETSTKRANNFTYATTAGKSEIILISVFAGVGVVLVSGAIIVPTVLKKKRRGLSE